MLAAVITSRNFAEAYDDLKKSKDCEVIEFRLDYMQEMELIKLKNFISRRKKPMIITCRKGSEGGFSNIDDTERIALLMKSIEFNADYIDIEYSSNKNSIKKIIENKKNTKIIISYHNLKETPKNLKIIFNNIKNLSPDFIKIVTNANSVTDNFRIFHLIKEASREKRRIIAFCMGSYGQFSRILSPMLGSKITYASVENGKESAIGQLTTEESTNIYRIKKLNKNTKILGLVGNPVEHSCSHIMHNAAFGKLGINAVYLKFKVDKLKEFIQYFRKLNILGFSVTIPHKIEVMKYLDDIDKRAKSIGAVNTIVFKNKKLIGYDTDCYGAMQALKEKTQIRNKNVAVLGAGGSSRALVYGLIENNANVTILNRTMEKAKSIADNFNCNYDSLNELDNINYDILINTTPLGMYPNADCSPVPVSSIKNDTVVFDIVFNPYKTKLLRYAEKKGCTIIPGIEMLINGAVLQFKLWTGKDAPEGLMREKVMDYFNLTDKSESLTKFNK